MRRICQTACGWAQGQAWIAFLSSAHMIGQHALRNRSPIGRMVCLLGNASGCKLDKMLDIDHQEWPMPIKRLLCARSTLTQRPLDTQPVPNHSSFTPPTCSGQGLGNQKKMCLQSRVSLGELTSSPISSLLILFTCNVVLKARGLTAFLNGCPINPRP